MLIRSVEAYVVAPRWLFVQVKTDAGIAGWGETGVTSLTPLVVDAIDDLSELLVGKDATAIEDHWQVLTKSHFYRGGPVLAAATGAIDQALWDIAGRALGVPVWQLLGGPVRDRMRIYAWVTLDDHGRDDVTIDEIAELAALRASQGFTAVKTAFGLSAFDTPARMDTLLAQVEAIRRAVGNDTDVALDLHGRCSKGMAKRILPLLEPARLMWVEEPLLPEHSHALRELTQITSLPLATGERFHLVHECKQALDGGVAILQPDVGNIGGISALRRVAALADVYDVLLAPHAASGPISLAATLQFDFATPNVLIQEQGIEYYTADVFGASYLDYLVDGSMFTITDGYLPRPDRPGLGLEVDETAVKRASELAPEPWRPPALRHADGSFAEW